MLKSTRLGARAEYMANYVLSHLGFTVPVPRQEDNGIDFFCALSEETETRVFSGTPYVVQCKSGETRNIEYGGKTKLGDWKSNEINFLFKLKSPLILAHVLVPEEKVLFYPLAICRFVKKEFPSCSKIVIEYLVEEGGSEHHQYDINNTKAIKNWNDAGGDGRVYKIKLQRPLLSVPISKLKDLPFIDQVKRILEVYIRMEHRNIIQDELSWPTFYWPSKYSTNNEEITYKWIHYTDNPELTNPDRILEDNGQLLNALAISYRLHNRIEEFDSLNVILKNLPDGHKFEELRSKFDLY